MIKAICWLILTATIQHLCLKELVYGFELLLRCCVQSADCKAYMWDDIRGCLSHRDLLIPLVIVS